MTTYTIPERNFGWLKEKIEKLNKKAEKLGVQPISVHVVKEELKEVRKTRVQDSVEAPLMAIEGYIGSVAEKVYTVEVVGEAPVLAGWKFIATLQHVQDNGDSATIIHAVPGQTVPVQYRETDGRWCDHCRTKRFRTDTFIVEKVKPEYISNPDFLPDEYKQVGRQCLKDFLGHPKPEMYADWATDLGLLDGLLRASGGPEESGYTNKYLSIVLTRTYTAAVVAAIRKLGWVSGKMAFEASERGEDLVRTRDVASGIIFGDETVQGIQIGDETVQGIQITKADIAEADRVIEWARTRLPEKVQRQPDNDYLYNLASVMRLEGLNYRVLGIAASAVPAYERDAKPRETDTDRAARSQYVGEVGVRPELVLTVSAIRGITYRDGTTGVVIEYQDDEGNEFVWFTSSRGGFEPGKTYVVGATIKRHSEFHGIKQTGLNRVSIKRAVA